MIEQVDSFRKSQANHGKLPLQRLVQNFAIVLKKEGLTSMQQSTQPIRTLTIRTELSIECADERGSRECKKALGWDTRTRTPTFLLGLLILAKDMTSPLEQIGTLEDR